MNLPPELTNLIYVILVAIAVGLVISLALLAWVLWRIKRINLPPDLGFFATLRATPLVVVLLLDALDFALDILSAPISWVILGRLGLNGLRGVTIVKDLIPVTQFIPAMTVAWVLARILPRLFPGSRLSA